jgi:hypothetical protein
MKERSACNACSFRWQDNLPTATALFAAEATLAVAR